MKIISRLPPGLCGVLLRHDMHPNRPALARRIAGLCRRRRLALIIAGDAKLAMRLRVGLHLRGGGSCRPRGWHGGLLSASVHNETQLKQAKRSGVMLIFMSPVFVTSSHPGAPVLGGAGWRRLARRAGRIKPYALGGINGKTVLELGVKCAGAGAIEAFF